MTESQISVAAKPPRILFVSPIVKFPPIGGPELRIDSSIKALSLISDLFVCANAAFTEAEYLATKRHYERYARAFDVVERRYKESTLGRFIKRVCNALCQRTIGRRVFELSAGDASQFVLALADKVEADLIWLGFGNISYPLLKVLKQKQSRPVVLDTDSVWSRYVMRGMPYASTPEERAEINAAGLAKIEEERWGTELADVTTAVSEVDASYYRELARRPDQVKIFCNAIDLASYAERPPAANGIQTPCLFLAGSFWAGSPMEDSARWVIGDILPRIRRRVSDVHLYVIGKGSDKVLQDVRSPAVTVAGQVPSVLPYLCYSAAALVPLRYESGTRFKILEAGACRVPVVSTTLGAEGLPVQHGKNILIGDDAEQFAQCVIDILLAPELGSRLASGLEEFVRDGYAVEALARQGANVLAAAQIRRCSGITR